MDNAQQPPGGAPPAGGKSVDPKAEAIYKKLGIEAMNIIYDPKVAPGLLNMLKAGAEMPAQAVAQAAHAVLGKMEESVKGIEPKLVYAAAMPVVVFLVEMGVAAKLFPEDPAIIHEALQMVGKQAMTQPEQPPAAPAAPAAPGGGLIGGAMQPQPMGA